MIGIGIGVGLLPSAPPAAGGGDPFDGGIIVNGDFTADITWTKGTGWTITPGTPGTANNSGTTGLGAQLTEALASPLTLVPWRVTFDVVTVSQEVAFRFTGAATETVTSGPISTGSHFIDFTPTAANTSVSIRGINATAFTITNITLHPL